MNKLFLDYCCRFDAARVFADYNSDTSKANFNSHYKATFDSAQDKFRSRNIHRAGKVNKPDPTNVHFLFDNTRFVNEPVCHAATEVSRHVQHEWWPEKIPTDSKPKPSYSCDSSNRSDFPPVDSSKRPRGLTRFGCIEGKRSTALGIVPVTELPASHIKTERISFNHQFDARNNMRQKGKLHGSLVWDTTNKREPNIQHRFVKRNFDYGVRKSPLEPLNYDAYALKPPERRSPDSPYIPSQVEEVKNEDKKTKQTMILAREQAKPREVQDDTNERHHLTLNNSGHKDSPPPHLC